MQVKPNTSLSDVHYFYIRNKNTTESAETVSLFPWQELFGTYKKMDHILYPQHPKTLTYTRYIPLGFFSFISAIFSYVNKISARVFGSPFQSFSQPGKEALLTTGLLCCAASPIKSIVGKDVLTSIAVPFKNKLACGGLGGGFV